MKYMKLGSKQDVFQSEGNNIRYIASELATDFVVNVGGVKFYLHKFPMLSKSNRLQRLVLKAEAEDDGDEIYMPDFPGGPKAFEMCAKFCYGMTVTVNAHNVVGLRCAAEYLEMSEDVEKGNLIFKIEVFLNSCVFRSWKDSIVVLQTTKYLLPLSEELKIVVRCVDSVVSKVSADPSTVKWSYTYNKSSSALNRRANISPPKDWWVEDLSELDVEIFKRVIVSIKSKGRIPPDVLGEALKAYAVRWLPDSFDALDSSDNYRSIVETIVYLLPTDKRSGCSCGFLLKLLKVAILVGVGDSLKEELMNRIVLQLHSASVKDLLIPAREPASGGTVYDIDLVKNLVKRYMNSGRKNGPECEEGRDNSGDANEFVLADASLLALGKVFDAYLARVAEDPNLRLSSFIEVSNTIPTAARPIHDGLYAAVDVYLREHTNLSKGEKKMLCRLFDVKKLSAEASMHSAQNERLPLRVVVQVIFFEQMRLAAVGLATITPESLGPDANKREDDWDRRITGDCGNVLGKQPRDPKNECSDGVNEINRSIAKTASGGRLLRSRSRRIFNKLWASKGRSENKRNSETTSGSSLSLPTSSANPGEGKSSGDSSSRNRRHSIS